jgi:acetyl esterase/lipase
MSGAWFDRIDTKVADVHDIRRRWHAWSNVLWTARGVKVRRGEINGLDAEWLTPKHAADGKLLLYLHGGGYVMGSCATHRQMVSYIAKAAGVQALLPEYRLAPEHRFPAAINDCVGAYRALLRQGYDAGDIVIAGDSAGGGLTMATLFVLREGGDPLPAAAFLLSPWLDLTGDGESMDTHADRDPWFKPEHMGLLTRHYCELDEKSDPLVSPVFGNFSGLPPIYIQVGEDEILLSDSTRAAKNIEAAGGTVELEIWPSLWHVFQVFVHTVPEARKAVKKLGNFVRRSLGIGDRSES